MSEPEFTPGPWKEYKTSPRQFYVGKPGDKALAEVICQSSIPQMDGSDKEELRANAHLIAAAPEMYLTLEKARRAMQLMLMDPEILSDEQKDYINEAIDEVQETLQKARGGDGYE